MNIRKIENKDTQAVSTICMNAFLKSIAGTLTDEGVATFTKIAASDAFLKRIKEDNLILVAEHNHEIMGVIELKEGRHIAMLFIDPKQQRKGVGRKLILSVLAHARCPSVTVSASLSSIAAYKSVGFECKGEVGESAGLVYQPMEIEVNNSITPLTDAKFE